MPIEFEQQVNGSAPVASSSQWAERAVLMDAKGSVRAVQFAPHHFGLKLVRIRVPLPSLPASFTRPASLHRQRSRLITTCASTNVSSSLHSRRGSSQKRLTYLRCPPRRNTRRRPLHIRSLPRRQRRRAQHWMARPSHLRQV